MGIDTGLRTLGTHTRVDQPTPDEIPDLLRLERETGIEPVSSAWKAEVLPLNYSRPAELTGLMPCTSDAAAETFRLVEEAGFEPA